MHRTMKWKKIELIVTSDKLKKFSGIFYLADQYTYTFPQNINKMDIHPIKMTVGTRVN